MKLIKSIQDKIEEKKKKLAKQSEDMSEDKENNMADKKEDDVIEGDSEAKENVTEETNEGGESKRQIKLIKGIQNKIKEKKAETRKKKLVKRFENMPDDELMDFVSEREDDVIDGDSETKETVTEAIKQIGESEEQVKLLTETPIGDELTGVQKTEIAKTISPEVLLDKPGRDLIADLPKSARFEIVRRVITSQEVKIGEMTLEEIDRSVKGIYRIVNYANDWKTIRYITSTKTRLKKLIDEPRKANETTGKEVAEEIERRKKQARPINRKLVAIAARKVVANYEQIGYSMRIMEFMNASLPLDELTDNIDVQRPKEVIEARLKRAQKEYFLEQVEEESSEEMKDIIADLLSKEEEREQRGKLAKIKRDAGEHAVQQIANIAQNTDLLKEEQDGEGRED